MPGIVIAPKSNNSFKSFKKASLFLSLILIIIGAVVYTKYFIKSSNLKLNSQSQTISSPAPLNFSDPSVKKSFTLGKVTDVGKSYLFVGDQRLPITDQTSCFYGNADKKAKVDCNQLQKGDQATVETVKQQTGENEFRVVGVSSIYFTH